METNNSPSADSDQADVQAPKKASFVSKHKKLLFILLTIGLISLLSGGFFWFQVRNNTQQSQAESQNGIRLIKCNNKNYIVERNIRNKRRVSAIGMSAFKFSSRQFKTGDSGCRYNTYPTPLSDKVRSKTTKKLYLVDRKFARLVQNQDMATAWKLGNIRTSKAPQLVGENIKRLASTRLDMATIAVRLITTPSASSSVYLVANGRRFTTNGLYSYSTGKFTQQCDSNRNGSLETDKSTVEVGLFSPSFIDRRLVAHSAGSDIVCDFLRSGDKHYMFESGYIRQISSSEIGRWRNTDLGSHSSSGLHPNNYSFPEATIRQWPRKATMGKYFKYKAPGATAPATYYRLTLAGDFHRTNNAATGQSWGVTNTDPTIGRIFNTILFFYSTEYP